MTQAPCLFYCIVCLLRTALRYLFIIAVEFHAETSHTCEKFIFFVEFFARGGGGGRARSLYATPP